MATVTVNINLVRSPFSYPTEMNGNQLLIFCEVSFVKCAESIG